MNINFSGMSIPKFLSNAERPKFGHQAPVTFGSGTKVNTSLTDDKVLGAQGRRETITGGNGDGSDF